MAKLGVNIDHIATLRQARGGFEPDPLRAAKIVEKCGANSLVMHLREDRRHMQDDDLFRIREAVSVRINLEMSMAPSIVKIAMRLKPDQVTLVPEKRDEKTTEGGLDLHKKQSSIKAVVAEFKKKNIDVSLFINPERRQLDAVKELGVEIVEFHTGDYANQSSPVNRKRELMKLRDAATYAAAMGVMTHAGHGLDYDNVSAVASIPGINELNIGYSIVTRSLWTGFERAVKDMMTAIAAAR